MYVINKEGVKLDYTYSSHDRFQEDIDYYINENFVFKVSGDDPINLLDVICGHLLHWYYKTFKEETQAILIYDDLCQQNEKINHLIKMGNPIPELVLYEFGGISVSDELNGDNILQNSDYGIIEITINDLGTLFMPIEEFDEMGGEIIFPDDDESDDQIDFEFSSSGNVYFFMNEMNLEEMGQYLRICLNELNYIYSSLDMPLIELNN